MADPAPDAGADPMVDPAPASGMPRWVKVSLIIVAVVILTFVILKIAGVGGEHGPGRHMGGSGTSSSSVPGHRPPPGVPNHGP